mmetsp:Transcript_28040/g.78646  ORF Transcript_28040/g.78646 Transcript_28040/m.78646 type:complete len:389 (+) Transcript_28040:536-1702(+)
MLLVVRRWWHLRDRSLVHFSNAFDCAVLLLQLGQLEPGVVVVRRGFQLLLVLRFLVAVHHVFDPLLVSELLFEVKVRVVQFLALLALVFWQIFLLVQRRRQVVAQIQELERMLVNDAGAFVLALPLLKGRELLEDACLARLFRFQLLQRRFEDGAGQLDLLGLPLGPLGESQEGSGARVRVDVPPEDGLRAIHRIVASFEPGVRQPRVVIRLPLHPPLEDGAAFGSVLHHLLHVHVLVPQEVDARQQLDGAVQHVARVVDELVPHLEFGVPQPELAGAAVHLQGAFEDAAGALVLLVLLLQPGVLDPIPDVLPAVADVVLKVLSAVPQVGLVLLGVMDLDDRLRHVLLLAIGGLSQNLLRRDLDRRRRAVLHLSLARHGIGCFLLLLL